MNIRRRWFLLIATALLTACTRPAPVPEAVRPVRLLQVQPSPADLGDVYAGEVLPRYQSSLGFRVAGKIAGRLVNVGDTVKAGQLLARLDPKDLSLSHAASEANVAAQAAQYQVERGDLERYRKLLAEGYVSKAEVDRQQMKADAAEAQLEALRAQSRVSGNQTSYAELRADHDGTVTTVVAEVGQVVAAGQPVLTLAWSGALEIGVDLPEQTVRDVKPGQAVEVSLWTVDGKHFDGSIREIATAADPATRTYRTRVAVTPPPAEMRLGMSASVRFRREAQPELIRLPLSAIVEQNQLPGVWIFDAQAGSVHFRPVQPAAFGRDDVMVGAGLQPGESVVIAGARMLIEGQKVRPLEALATAR